MYRIKYTNGVEVVKSFRDMDALTWFVSTNKSVIYGYQKIK